MRAALPGLAFLFLVCFAAGAPPVAAQSVHTPPAGSADRAAILEEVRVPVELMLHPPVEFVVKRINVGGGWAFVALEPQRPGGGRIPVETTRFAQDAGAMDGLTTFALLREANGRWHLIDWVVGPTDVAWDWWPEHFGAPRALFP